MKVVRTLGFLLVLLLPAGLVGCEAETVVEPDPTSEESPDEVKAREEAYEDEMNKQAEQVEATQGG